VLNGTKQFISGAGTTDFYFIFVRTGDEGANGRLGVRGDEGHARVLSFGANEKKMGWNAQPTRPGDHGELQGAGGQSDRRGGKGFRFAMSGARRRAHQHRRLLGGGGVVGARQGAQYMFERKAFGRNIGDFQAMQFKIADMATDLEAARLMIYRAADAMDRADPQASMYSAMAKRMATDLGFKVCNEALQIHGGYGYLKDYGLEKLVRDLRVHQILEGTNEIMRVVISRKVLGGNRG
jgi:alkylation response protein AidB-like acyl-CoA dehydrogenase